MQETFFSLFTLSFVFLYLAVCVCEQASWLTDFSIFFPLSTFELYFYYYCYCYIEFESCQESIEFHKVFININNNNALHFLIFSCLAYVFCCILSLNRFHRLQFFHQLKLFPSTADNRITIETDATWNGTSERRRNGIFIAYTFGRF